MARRSAVPNVQIDLIGPIELLREHITPALCGAVFGRVRRTERQRKWTRWWGSGPR